MFNLRLPWYGIRGYLVHEIQFSEKIFLAIELLMAVLESPPAKSHFLWGKYTVILSCTT